MGEKTRKFRTQFNTYEKKYVGILVSDKDRQYISFRDHNIQVHSQNYRYLLYIKMYKTVQIF